MKVKKICKKINTLSREKLANPFLNETYEERLIKSGAIDLRDNCIIEDLGNGIQGLFLLMRIKNLWDFRFTIGYFCS